MSSASGGYSQIRQKQATSIYGGQECKGKGPVHPSAPEIPKHMPVLSVIFEQVGHNFFKVHKEERRDKSDNQQDQNKFQARERPPHLGLQGEREHPGQGSDYHSEASRFSSASRWPTNRHHHRSKGDPEDPDNSSDDDAGLNNNRRPRHFPLGSKPRKGSPF